MHLRLLFFFLFFLLFGQRAGADDAPVVAVAANFSPTAHEIMKQFTASTGKELRISTGASGTLVRQIEQGAPFQLFLSADENYVERLHSKGLTSNAGRIYANGVLVLYIPYESKLDKMDDSESMLRKLAANHQFRIAVANPELAPYGVAAKQVLQRFTQWHMLQGRIILGENVGQTAQFALTGSVDMALLPYALVIKSEMQHAGHFQLMPDDWYAPIKQRMVLLKNAGSIAREFYDYLSSDTAQQVITKYGFKLPSDQ